MGSATAKEVREERGAHDVDWVIVGSGFGGSVPALRLAEKGYDVLVLEQGRRFEDADFAKTAVRCTSSCGCRGSVCGGSWPSPPSSTCR